MVQTEATMLAGARNVGTPVAVVMVIVVGEPYSTVKFVFTYW